MNDDEKRVAALVLERTAKAAEGDLEEAICQLDELVEARRKDPVIEERYEELRDLVAKAILKDGPRYYLDDRGDKRYAFAVQPEPVEIDVAELIAMNGRGELAGEVLDQIAPRKVDKEAFRRAASTGRLTKAQVAATCKITKGTAHVRFTDPYDQG